MLEKNVTVSAMKIKESVNGAERGCAAEKDLKEVGVMVLLVDQVIINA